MLGADRPKGKPYSQDRADARWEGEGGAQEESDQEDAGHEAPGEEAPDSEDRTGS
ncbi:MAG: hypothetical protein WBA87_09270 [Microbacterium sp.]